MDSTIFSSISQVEKLRRAGDHWDFSVMGSVNYRLHPWSLQSTEGYFIVLIMQKPQNYLTKRKGPTWCKNVRKQIFFRFWCLIMAKIYHALIVVYLILYPRYHYECCKHGRSQGAFLAVWVGHRCLAQGVSPLIPPICVCPWTRCAALLAGAKACACTPAPALQLCLVLLWLSQRPFFLSSFIEIPDLITSICMVVLTLALENHLNTPHDPNTEFSTT